MRQETFKNDLFSSFAGQDQSRHYPDDGFNRTILNWGEKLYSTAKDSFLKEMRPCKALKT